MPVTKRIVCLANSKKMSGRCLAGREILPSEPGPWIRPVSARITEEVSEYERQYQDGSDPRVLDLIDVPLIGPRPHACQTENWLLEPDEYWERVGQIGWKSLQGLLEQPSILWRNGSSTNNGLHDQIAKPEADALPSSLYLVHVKGITLKVSAPGAAFGNTKRRVQARFAFNGVQYWLWVTDPIIEREYLAQQNGDYVVGESCLCISLSEPFNEHRYKLVASIIQKSLVAQ